MANEERSVSFEPRDVQDLSRFFLDNKNRYHEIWVVLTKKKGDAQQPVTSILRLTKL